MTSLDLGNIIIRNQKEIAQSQTPNQQARLAKERETLQAIGEKAYREKLSLYGSWDNLTINRIYSEIRDLEIASGRFQPKHFQDQTPTEKRKKLAEHYSKQVMMAQLDIRLIKAEKTGESPFE